MEESEICFWTIGGNHSKEWVRALIFENFAEGQIYSLAPIFNSQCGEVSLNKKQVFHYQLIHKLWIVIYLKSKRIQRSKIMNVHKSYCILHVFLLRFQRIRKLVIQHTDHSCLFLREFLPNITRHPLRSPISFSEFYATMKIMFPIVLKTFMSVRFEYFGLRIVSGVEWENTISIKISF
jgi:hypothetical protein